ncbi:hypothetical protein [Oceanobacillus oncorhynchi]|uniref:hypothetical protein n=1 Tax=Oceanobacillus oncorhynchi TaxID=545501 RepID=UPI0034D73C27
MLLSFPKSGIAIKYENVEAIQRTKDGTAILTKNNTFLVKESFEKILDAMDKIKKS